MSLATFSPGRPPCLNCMRRAFNGFNEAWLSSTRPQIRGKKKLAKSTTIKVRLLENIPRCGRKGSIISIPPGRMRNDFFPRAKAEYMTTAQLREVRLLDAATERASTFGTALRQVAAQESKDTDGPVAVTVEVNLLKPERALKVVSKLLPSNIAFYRTPIASTTPTPQRHSPSLSAVSAISAAAQEAAHPQGSQEISIYGSVTTTDIAENLRAILAEDSEGARVALTAEDINFVGNREEKDRVKQLGTFEIDVGVRGATTTVRRTITIKAQE